VRRIIERVVTVVTTTTWKISWEADPPRPVPPVELASLESPAPEMPQATMEMKEVDVSTRKDRNKTIDE
jgi:hypothetical protein